MSSLSGVAIHSGLTSRVTLHREAGPLRFRRGQAVIEATVSNVIGAQRATSLGSGGAQVHLVEHLLAALRVAGFFEGVLVEVSCDELPILDGSAAPWAEPIAALGAPPPAPAPLVLTEPLTVEANGGRATLAPGPERLACEIDFAHPAIGRQRWCGGPDAYPELLDARTFGFLADWEALKARGLALGASERHAIVFDDDGPLRPLRHADEPVRHKALDALGDLALLGRPLHAEASIQRGSHALHHAMARAVVTRAAADGRA
ncbi:MAG: UDP-3-O-acyl-N-acetylglucosamine deacetylase [Deinococcales bacterium]|nr:UDP-3-O-acyl-N-acetylglucosamine deacetylase [Deinococcales bacterium]